MPPRRKRPARALPKTVFHLYTVGHLTSDEARALGVRVMQCTQCRAEVDLVCTFAPVSVEDLATLQTLPGLVWGEDVLVVCRCCSLPGCPHGKEPA